MKLNPAQREAVITLEGPLLVLAGAGTGKTRVVIHRIAEIIRSGTSPEKILAVTFTKKAAAEMQQRATELLSQRTKQKPHISTFHSLCVRILRRHIRRLGYPDAFSIYDRGDAESIAKAALQEIKVSNEAMRPGDLLAAISRWKTRSVRPPQAEARAATDREHLQAMAYRRYQKALQARGAVDFDDLLLLVEELFARFPEVLSQEAGRFYHLLVDEYQDTNGAQYRIVKALAQGHRNLCVVGDDDQSIYGWRGAEVSHILQFKRDWPDAKVICLENNYRSKGPILEMANRLIVFNRKRHAKTLRAVRGGGERPRILQFDTETDEARGVALEIRSQVTGKQALGGDFVILFRTNEQTRAFETELRRIDLPYVMVGGMSFFDRKEVRDILAYLKLIANRGDEASLLRILNTPPRGIGQSTVTKLMQRAIAKNHPLWQTLSHVTPDREVSTGAAKSIADFRGMIGTYAKRLCGNGMTQTLRSLLDEIGYERELERTCRDPNQRLARWNTVQEVVNAMAEYEEQSARPTLIGFLDDVTLDPRVDNNDKESKLRRDSVTLMTLHSAKGLEFAQVYMVGMEEGVLPHHRSMGELQQSIDEERRLCYVGMTRAQDRLTLTLPLSRRKWGKARPTRPSRFLYEMTGQAERGRHSPASKTKQPAASRSRRKK